MTKKNILVIGYGYVGKAIVNFFKDHFAVSIYDNNQSVKDKYPDLNFIKREDIEKLDFDLTVICVPTPMKENGECDVGIVRSSIAIFNKKNNLILIKSTIPPGTTKVFSEIFGNKNICFSPEYIGEGSYMISWWKGYPHHKDIKYHDFQIFGGDRQAASRILEFFKKVLGPDCRYFKTDSTTAEIVKYMENSWGAAKVTFCNEFFEICKAFGVDYDEVRELFLLDGRTERMHTAVFKEKRGFGGKCYPKDVNAIIKATEAAGYTPQLLKEILNTNKKFVDKN